MRRDYTDVRAPCKHVLHAPRRRPPFRLRCRRLVYSFDWTGDVGAWLARVGRRQTWGQVAPNVWFIGLTSLLTDISSEMVASILPLYLVIGLGLSPFVFGVVDGLYPGVTALVRWGGGALGDRTRQHKGLAATGYGLSSLSRIVWLFIGGHVPGIVATVTADRIGKGVRTAPRDALISLSTPPARLGAAFGVHRAMDAAGAMLGPLTAALVLALAPQRFDIVFVVSFSLGIVGLAVLLLFVRNNPGEDAVQAREREVRPRPSLLIPRQRGLWLTLAGGAGLALVTISDAFIYLVLQRRGLVAPATIPLLYVGTNATYLLLAIPMGGLADRWARWKIFILGHLALVVVYAALLAPVAGWGLVALVLIGLGAYYAATDGVLSAMASAVLPRADRGSGLGLLATATSLGRLGASLAFGWIWASWSDTAALALFAATLPAVVVTSAMLLSRAQREIIGP
jgi:MFS family permease